MGADVELLVIEKIEVDGRAGFAVRCHAESLRVGNSMPLGIEPNGEQHRIRVRCTGISLAPGAPGEVLEANYGGGIVLEGDEVGMIDQDWALRASATAE